MKTPTRPQQIFLYIAPFAPLAFFKVWASIGANAGSLSAVARCVLVCCLIVL
jgi:hypothetical protein